MAPSPSPLPALLLALLCAPTGLGVPGGRWGAQPHAGCPAGETSPSCRAGGLCPSAEDPCSACQQTLSLLGRVANESAAKAALERVVQRECAALPVPAAVAPCQRLLRRGLALLAAALRGPLKPAALCARLDLCPAPPGARVAPLLPPGARLRLGAPPLGSRVNVRRGGELPVPLPLCWLCRAFVARAEAAVPRAAVAGAAARLCRLLPAPAAAACECAAERAALALLDALLARAAPRLLCAALLACGARGPPELDPAGMSPEVALGPCALGPAYWCSSGAAARRCQAVQHCRDRAAP